MIKHTPGPWKAHPDRWVTTDDANLERIAKVADASDDVEVTDERADADAHLIAAAPDLLKAAEDALELLKRLRNAEGAYRVTCIAQLAAALAKAKGEA
jgi:hypothetical protein